MKRERERDRRDSYQSRDSRRDRDRDEEDSAAVSTLHVRNLPPDVKDRELRLLACFLPGFESSLVVSKEGSPIGFIKFSTQVHALAATNQLQGLLFDESQKDTILKVSLAKRDMNVRSSSRSMASSFSSAPFSSYSALPFSTGFPYGLGAYGGDGNLAAYASAFSAAVAAAQRPDNNRYTSGSGKYSFAVQVRTGGDPCDTLCLRNLPPTANDEDLELVFGKLEGYLCQKFLGSKALAFLKFGSEADAKKALDAMSGSSIVLSGSSMHPTLSLEYAKRSLEIRDQ